MLNSPTTALHETTVGGWSTYRKLTPEEEAVFKASTAHINDVEYVPYAVSIQVVNGVNYKFKCDASLVPPAILSYKALVEIHQPINGVPYVVKRRPLPIANTTENVTGGWSPYCKLTPEDDEVFEDITKSLLGVEYTAELVATQVVNGTNYRFNARALPLVPAATSYEVVIEVYQAIGQTPIVTGIERI